MRQAATVPDSHRDLFERPIVAVLATVFSSGFPQAQPVWCDWDGTNVLVSTALERAKARNMAERGVATVLVVDPDDTSRWVEVRGDVEIDREGAVELADRLARRYTRHDRYYGGVFPADQQQRETRVVCRIRPTRVNLDAIHR